MSLDIKKHFQCTRLLCSWHIQRNFVSKLSGLMKKDSKLYEKGKTYPEDLYEGFQKFIWRIFFI